MEKYLYGASVQGIQEFIFKTNKLQEIIGASEIVKEIDERIKKKLPKEYEKNIIINSAGNIKIIFDKKEDVQKIVLEFLKELKQSAYGITVSQAVVKLGEDYQENLQNYINELEKKLKVQRNIPDTPLDMSISIMKLSPQTSRPAVRYAKENKLLDMASYQKREAYQKWFERERKEKKEFEKYKDISSLSNHLKKIAIIHADGNGLGELVPKLGKDLQTFSKELDEATKKAFSRAKEGKTKIRKIILGGDDMVAICSASEALEFIEEYLKYFEEETSKIEVLKKHKDKLTACAGIAYCNEKFPFHYAVGLAEELCSEAKKLSNREASAILFHNIQSASYQSWEKYIEDELTIKSDEETIFCNFGPYYLNKEGKPKIKDLKNIVLAYSEGDSVLSKLRRWIGELHQNYQYAQNLLNRIYALSTKEYNTAMDNNLKKLHSELSGKKLIVEIEKDKKTPIYDILQIHSVTGRAKNDED